MTDPVSPCPIVIIGAGGFASEGIWTLEDINTESLRAGNSAPWNILGFAVYNPAEFPKTLYSYPVLGTPKDVTARNPGTEIFFNCMIGDNRIREQKVREAEALGWKPAALVHPSVTRARETVVDAGAYVGAGSIISPFAKIGAHAIVNHHVSVGHDSVLHDFSQACPGARISGKCVLGRSALMGSNSTLLPGCKVAEGAVIGAGSVALRSVAADTTVMGVPAVLMGRRETRECAK